MKKTNNYLNRDFKRERSDDALTKEKRSSLMAKIRSKNTKFEKDFMVQLRKATDERFRTNVTTIKGKPDIVFIKKKICVFLDSDFWHGWDYPRWKHLLKNDFWREKIENNRKRDKKTTTYLRNNGFTVLRFWEHQLKTNPRKYLDIIKDRLGSGQQRRGNCANRNVLAIIAKDGKFYTGTNWCRNPQKKCPRIPGDGYSKCKSVCEQDGHAEIDAIKNTEGKARGAVMYLIGHDHCCDECMVAMRRAGIEKVVFGKYPKGFKASKPVD